MKFVFKMLKLFDDNEIYRGYTTMIEQYNALKFLTLLFLIQKILTFNLCVAFLKSVSIYQSKINPFWLCEIAWFPWQSIMRY